ncbi:MAG: hypothetical protein ABIA74_02565 [bacterium]
MQLTIPKGHQITPTADKTLEIKINNSRFSILGEQQPTKLWNAYLIDPNNSYKKIIQKDIKTKAFSIFANIILKTPFPFSH